MRTALKVIAVLALAVIMGSAGFIGGFAVARSGEGVVPEFTEEPSELTERIDEVNEILQREALKPPSETSATAGALQGLLESGGDAYGLYFDPQHFKYFNEESAGEFGGIGVVLGEKDGTAYVVEVYKGTPAMKGGVKAGDVFMEIDGVRRAKWTTQEVVKRVRGEEGSKVKIIFLRPNKDAEKAGHPGGPVGKEFSVQLTRAMIKLPNIESELKGTVGYIRLSQFNAMSDVELTEALEDLDKKGAKSYVLDLRDNPGGLLSQAVSVSSLFLDSGVVVRIEERGRKPVEEHTVGSKITDAPLVVLVNENSASASEIVAGALQDHGRAKIIGVTTFGKGSVQNIKQLSFGGAIKYTTAHYLTPKKRTIDGIGVVPDVVVKMDPEKQAEEKTDAQLRRALSLAAQAR